MFILLLIAVAIVLVGSPVVMARPAFVGAAQDVGGGPFRTAQVHAQAPRREVLGGVITVVWALVTLCVFVPAGGMWVAIEPAQAWPLAATVASGAALSLCSFAVAGLFFAGKRSHPFVGRIATWSRWHHGLVPPMVAICAMNVRIERDNVVEDALVAAMFSAVPAFVGYVHAASLVARREP